MCMLMVFFTDIEPVEDCLVSMVNGSVKVNQNRKRVTLQFSSDGGSLITYKCKLDNRNFKECELICNYLAIRL